MRQQCQLCARRDRRLVINRVRARLYVVINWPATYPVRDPATMYPSTLTTRNLNSD